MALRFTIGRGCDDPCRADPENPVAQTAQAAELEDGHRRDRRRLAGLCGGSAPGPDEAAPGAGRARCLALRPDGGRSAAVAGGALSRLVAGRGADRPLDLPLLRVG